MCPNIEIILLSQSDKEVRKWANQARVFRCRAQSCDLDELVSIVRSASDLIKQRSVMSELRRLQDHEQVIEEVIASISKLAVADEAAILLIEAETGKLYRYPKTPIGDEKVSRIFVRRNSSREIIEKNKMVIISETLGSRQVSIDFQRTGIHSLIGVPIPNNNGGNIGILFAFSRKPGHFDDYGKSNLLRNLASAIGPLLVSTRALKQTRKQVDFMEELIKVGNQLTQTDDLKKLCSFAWNFVSSQLESFFFSLGDL